MKTEEELDTRYDEERQKALDGLTAAIEQKRKPVDELEAEYTQTLKKIFENYKKEKLRVISVPASHAKQRPLKKLLSLIRRT